ncbi:hypothetical protein CDAR_9421 [Caerostris darwini]|uniref:Uncharacterized protein n=1 Tax=Caerostris darwini TaxID=1538125 RepID=A0AAV4NY47_9ARAC|nr:hypothetical protein CDAR_9421 [Caerostris darwini]
MDNTCSDIVPDNAMLNVHCLQFRHILYANGQFIIRIVSHLECNIKQPHPHWIWLKSLGVSSLTNTSGILHSCVHLIRCANRCAQYMTNCLTTPNNVTFSRFILAIFTHSTSFATPCPIAFFICLLDTYYNLSKFENETFIYENVM